MIFKKNFVLIVVILSLLSFNLVSCSNNEDEIVFEKNLEDKRVVDLLPYKNSGNQKWGYMDSQGNVKIQPQYDNAWFFCGNTAVVMDDNNEITTQHTKYGYIDSDGKVVIPIIYDFADSASDGIFRVLKEYPDQTDLGTWFYLEENGNTLLEGNYWRTGPFSEGLTAVSEGMGSKYGFVDITGKYVITPKYGDVGYFSEGLAYFCKNYPEGKYGYINKENKVVIKAVYDDAKDFSEGYAAVQKGDKWGFIDKKGEMVIPFKFDEAGTFSENVAAVKENDLWGFIDYNGEYVLSPQYPNVGRCYKGLIMVMDEMVGFPGMYDFSHYVNLKGEIIEPNL